MARYELIYLPSVAKDLRGISKADVRKILARTESLANDPRPSVSIKLAGAERYRIRQGNYRILYSIDEDQIIVVVVRIGHRGDVYRD